MSVSVRRAGPDDVAAIVDLGAAVVPATYGPLSPAYAEWCLERWWSTEAVTESVGRLPHWVALDGDRVVGVTNLGELDGSPVMWKLYVRPEQHGRGVGTLLLHQVVAAADGAPLVLERLSGNERAARFYAARGFTETHRTVAETFPDLTWVWMRRDPETVTDGAQS